MREFDRLMASDAITCRYPENKIVLDACKLTMRDAGSISEVANMYHAIWPIVEDWGKNRVRDATMARILSMTGGNKIAIKRTLRNRFHGLERYESMGKWIHSGRKIVDAVGGSVDFWQQGSRWGGRRWRARRGQ